MANCKLTVIAPCRNEGKYITSFIDNMLSQDFSKDDIEILIIDGQSDDNTQNVISNYTSKFPFIKLLVNEKRTVPYALNLGIRQAKGEFIIRVDLHAVYPQNYFTKLISKFCELQADNLGGVCETLPAKDDNLCKAIATVMSNGFGVGNSYFRIGASEIVKVDTVPFGCFRRELFDKIGLFDEELTRNQDDEFNARIIKNGGIIYLLPDLKIKYFARDSVNKLARMFYQYGLFKPLVNKKLGFPATIRQFIPLCFLVGLVIGAIISIFFKTILFAYITLIGIYLLASVYFTRNEIKKEPIQILYLPWLFAILHLSYGWGYLRGIVGFLILNKQSANVTINR